MNISHRVRFWDSENVSNVAQTGYANYLNHYRLDTLDMTIVDFWQKQGYSYQDSLCKHLNLPLITSVRRELNFHNLYNLILAFKEKNTDIAFQMLCYFKKLDRQDLSKNFYSRNANEQKRHCLKYFEAIRVKFPALSFNQFLEKFDYYEDCYFLMNRMDKTTRSLFSEMRIPLKKLHDWLSVEVANQKYREMLFDIPDHIFKRLDMQLNNYNLTTIAKNSQLVTAAKSLKNCAVNRQNFINENLQLVVITDGKGKIKALLEIEYDHIVQAKLYGNKKVKTHTEINRLVIEFAKKANLSINTTDISVNTEAVATVVA